MKSMFKLFGIIAFVAVIGFVTACSNGGGGGGGSPTTSGPTSATYVSYDEFETKYELVITNSATGRAAYNPKNGDRYTLTITPVNGTVRISTGTVEINTDNASIILIHSGSGTKVTVTVSGGEGGGGVTSFSVDIPVDNGAAVPKPGPLPYSPNSGGNGYVIIGGESFVKNNGIAIIPATFRNLPVTAIGPMAFANNKNLTSVTIPASVTDFLTFDGGWSGQFQDCINLTTVNFAAGSRLQSLGSGAFYGCTSLKSIEIPASVTSFGEWLVFGDCTSLETVTFAPNSRLENLGNEAFYRCTSLKSIEIPASVTAIGTDNNSWAGTFFLCTSLKTVTFAPNSRLKILGEQTFQGCINLTSINIPAGVTSIGICMFYGCASLTSITIPANVTSIGGGAFSMANDDQIDSKLTTITFEAGSKLKSIGDGAFGICTSVTSITIPAGVTSIGKEAFAMWTPSQTINIQGHASQAAADAAWGEDWRDNCDTVIKYWNGSAFM